MKPRAFSPGEEDRVTWTSLKRQHDARIIRADHSDGMRGYVVEYDDMPGERWIPETGIEPRDDSRTGGVTP